MDEGLLCGRKARGLGVAHAGLNDHVHADQVGQRLGAHLVHDIAAMDFGCAFAQPSDRPR